MAIRKPPADRPGTPLTNRNFLSPVGFKFSLKRAPAVAFFCNQANIPSMDLGIAEQPSYLRNIPVPGDKIEFGDLTLRFLVDEDLVNYMEIQNWIRGIGFPENLTQIYEFQKNDKEKSPYAETGELNLYSDGTLTILDSMNRPKFKVKFNDMFPYRLSTLEFDATQTDIEYFTALVSFKYSIYNIDEIVDCC